MVVTVTVAEVQRGSKGKTSLTAIKTFKVLEYVAEAAEPVTAIQVARGLDLDRATCYRLLVTLVEAGYVEHDLENRTFSLTYRVVTLARRLLSEGRTTETVREVMRWISKSTTETCHFSVFDNDHAVIVLREKGLQLVSVDFAVGDKSELYCTAVGKAILAFQDVRVIDRILSRPMEKRTRNTIVDPDLLRKELIKIRSHGISYDNEELMDGLRCLAAPVFEQDGSVKSAFALSGPIHRFTDQRVAELETVLRDGVRELSRRIGSLEWDA